MCGSREGPVASFSIFYQSTWIHRVVKQPKQWCVPLQQRAILSHRKVFCHLSWTFQSLKIFFPGDPCMPFAPKNVCFTGSKLSFICHVLPFFWGWKKLTLQRGPSSRLEAEESKKELLKVAKTTGNLYILVAEVCEKVSGLWVVSFPKLGAPYLEV